MRWSPRAVLFTCIARLGGAALRPYVWLTSSGPPSACLLLWVSREGGREGVRASGEGGSEGVRDKGGVTLEPRCLYERLHLRSCLVARAERGGSAQPEARPP